MVPGARASFKLTHVVIIGTYPTKTSTAVTRHLRSTSKQFLQNHRILTCIKISDDVNTGSYGHSSVHKGGAGRDAQVLVIQVDPPGSKAAHKTEKSTKDRVSRTRCNANLDFQVTTDVLPAIHSNSARAGRPRIAKHRVCTFLSASLSPRF